MDEKMTLETELFNDKEAANKLKLSVVTLWRERKKGNLGYCMIAGNLRYSRKHLEDYLNRDVKMTKC